MPNTPKLPHNLDAERAVLGAVILNPQSAALAFSLLVAEEFFLPHHVTIYRAMQLLSIGGQEIDLVTLVEELQREHQLEKVGGAGYVAQLIDGVPKVTNVNHYASIVRQKAQLRKFIYFCDEGLRLALDSQELPTVLFEQSIQKLLAIVSNGDGAPLVRKWRDVSQQAIQEIKQAHTHPNQSTRLRFGLTELDDMTSGLRKRELVVIVGPTSAGKTLLAEQLAITAESDGYRGIIFSAEMPGEQLALRQLAHEAGVKFYFVRRPERLNHSEVEALGKVSERDRNLTIVERGISPMHVWAISEAHKRAHGLDFVIVDYDQLVIETGIDSDRDEEGFFRHQRRFILQAKQIAERLNICFVLLCQLRKVSPKVVQGGKPTIDDIYGDSAIRNSPHLIIWIVREFFTHNLNKEYERKVTIWVVKSRNDRTGKVQLEFDPERLRLLDAPPSEKDSVPDTTRDPGEE